VNDGAAEHIGVIGLGAMGRLMALRLLSAGYRVSVWNRSPQPVTELLSAGASSAASPSDLAQDCNVVLTMVSDGPDVEQVAAGVGGILTAPASGLLWIDCSSIAPEVSRSLAERAARRGIVCIDAPVSGGTTGARNGTLAIMVGGDPSAYERALPVLKALGSNIVHVGGHGSGQIIKLVNQMIVGGTIALVAEAYEFARLTGANVAVVPSALSGGFADSKILQIHGQRMLTGTFEPGFRSTLQLKDLENASTMARMCGAFTPLTDVVCQLYGSMQRSGRGAQDHSGVINVYRDRATHDGGDGT
jgi:2-hydroxy-3-oxopropionate reductase